MNSGGSNPGYLPIPPYNEKEITVPGNSSITLSSGYRYLLDNNSIGSLYINGDYSKSTYNIWSSLTKIQYTDSIGAYVIIDEKKRYYVVVGGTTLNNLTNVSITLYYYLIN